MPPRATRSTARGGKAAVPKPARKSTTRTYTRLEDECISSDTPEPTIESEDEPAPPPKKRARATKATIKAAKATTAAKATKSKVTPPADDDIVLSEVESLEESAPPPKKQARPRSRPFVPEASPDIVELDSPPPAYSPVRKLKAEVVMKLTR